MNEGKRIYFVRHGTPQRLPNQFMGITQAPLTEQGKTEAQETGKWFAGQGFSGLIYASPLSRAYDTARLIGEEITKVNHGFVGDVKIKEDFRECNFGLAEGMTIEDFTKRYPQETAVWYQNPFENPFPQGESFLQCGKRFQAAVEHILEENRDNDKDILVAAHMCVIQSYFIVKGLCSFDNDFISEPIPCASISCVLYQKGRLILEKRGYLPHVDGAIS